MEQTYVYVYDILPDIEVEYDHDKFHKCEREVISPALRELGYEIGDKPYWYTSEGDSFGPLSRAIRASKDGKPVIVWYG